MAIDIRNKFLDMLLGKKMEVAQPQTVVSNVYPEKIQNYLNALPQQDYAKDLFNQPKQVAMPQREINSKIANGLNFGIPEIAQAQRDLGIRVPKTEQEIEDARLGMFNKYPDTNIISGVANNPRSGGFLNDIIEGYRENLTQDFNPANWEADKNIANRIGESVGTAVKAFNKPVGRGLATAGLISAFGGTPADALIYGTVAGVGRQQNIINDKLYRSKLKNLGYSNADIDNLGGVVTEDTFKTLAAANKLTNQVKWGDLADLNPQIAEAIAQNPELADSFAPATVVNQILKSDLTNAQVENLQARTGKTKEETKYVGKPTEKRSYATIEYKGLGSKSKSETKKPLGTSGSSNGGDMVKMKAPNGRIYNVPKSRLSEFIKAGGRVVD